MCPLVVDLVSLEPSNQVKDWGKCNKDCPMRRYLSNRDIQDIISNLALSNPTLAQTYNLTHRSVLGEDLVAIRLTANADKPRPLLKPLVRLSANMHGNEVVGREILVELAKLLVHGYSLDTRIRNIMDNVEVHLLPTMNPDGFNRATIGSCGGQDFLSGRWNENKIDLNRNFPSWFQLQLNKSIQQILETKEPEVRAVANWILSESWILGANFHDGAVLATFPWDFYKGDQRIGDHITEDDEVNRYITGEYADKHLTMTNGSACAKYSYLGPTANGAAWYPKNGTLKDFGYIVGSGLEYVFELSCCKFPSTYFLPREFENNRESLLGFLEIALTGVRGQLLDTKGQPVPGANIDFTKNEKLGGKPVTSNGRGEFWKILVPGKYSVLAESENCFKSDVLTIDVTSSSVKTVELVLKKLPNCL
ncbi:carboxypeptidase D isoform X2 [Eurytemora carolleeae]|nr:carboxypeptidase D isoform X2 [Eurytemora carolleeae]XP_023325364.1 carboxypeptidase D isoform X2 [Eurytemora carolleeae]XP_023325365.1 carboxypeptidase D isoform X2 [Eurytemora carolleeae]XP_023325367.1 carboxypeptidase D isoform X2 [Eurytemora carolleeae]|eukprot:XP_023325363.1 carboxypeptidase D-like isoform X2 [Eurytemora affinis]